MKILSNFDTRMDKKIFLKKIEQYWDWNVLLVKRHPLFLYKAFINWILSLILFIALISILYVEYSNNIELFYIFTILHIFWIGLWILFLFKKIISHLRSYKEFIQSRAELKDIDFGDFWRFIKYSFFLFIYQFIVSIIDIIVLLNISENNWITAWWWITMFIINALFLFLIVRILQRFIDFEMDFITITPDEIESVNQTGIFKRKIVSLDSKKIRSISTKKNWFFRSLFNIGSLIILSEWDSWNHWEVQFNYIHRLWKLKKGILELIKKWEKKNKNDNNNN